MAETAYSASYIFDQAFGIHILQQGGRELVHCRISYGAMPLVVLQDDLPHRLCNSNCKGSTVEPPNQGPSKKRTNSQKGHFTMPQKYDFP